jgi:radical SAM protein with 4Fe4S-binding SPASM domain
VTPLLTREAAVRMREVGAKTVSISLDGACAATHDGIRGVEGHFEATRDAVRLLVDEGHTVQVNTTVMRRNADELADVAALVHDWGADIWEVFFLILVGRGVELEELTPSENEDVVQFLFDASRYGFTVRTVEAPFFRRVVAWRTQVGEDVDARARFGLGRRYAGLSARLRERLGPPRAPARARSAGTRDGTGVLFVSHAGDLYPSGFLPLRLGNVARDDVVRVYREHPLLRAIRAAEFSGRCGACAFADACGGSRARAFAATGDPLAEDPACGYVPGASVS